MPLAISYIAGHLPDTLYPHQITTKPNYFQWKCYSHTHTNTHATDKYEQKSWSFSVQRPAKFYVYIHKCFWTKRSVRVSSIMEYGILVGWWNFWHTLQLENKRLVYGLFELFELFVASNAYTHTCALTLMQACSDYRDFSTTQLMRDKALSTSPFIRQNLLSFLLCISSSLVHCLLFILCRSATSNPSFALFLTRTPSRETLFIRFFWHIFQTFQSVYHAPC